MTEKFEARPAKPREQMKRTVQMIEVASEVCLTNAPLVRSDIKRGAWVESLTESRNRITETLRLLEKS